MNNFPAWQQYVVELLVAWTLLLGLATAWIYSTIQHLRSELERARKQRWWLQREQQKHQERI